MTDPAIPRRVLTGEAGLAILPTGVIRIAESYAVFANPAMAHSARIDAIRRAIGHEMIHFIQSISTGFVFDRCEDARKLAVRFNKAASAEQVDWDDIRSISPKVEKIDELFDEQHSIASMPGIAVSPRQLMEATAVIESSRQLRHNMTIADLLADIDETVGANPVYTYVISIARNLIGDDAALRLIPALVFLALGTPKPGETFLELLSKLSANEASNLARMSQSFILGEDPEYESSDTLIARFKAGERLSSLPFVNNYAAAFAASGTLEQMRMVAAYPSHVLAVSKLSHELRDVEKWNAPITMFEDGYIKLGGQLANASQQEVEVHRNCTEILGVMYQTCQSRHYATSCTLTECPAHASALCHLAVPHKPKEQGGDWNDCPFRERFGQWFRMTPEAFWDHATANLKET